MIDSPWTTVIVAAIVLIILALVYDRRHRKSYANRTRVAALSPAERSAYEEELEAKHAESDAKRAERDVQVEAKRAAQEVLSAAKSAHKSALQEYNQRVSAAQKEYRRESNTVASDLNRAEKQMKIAEATGRKLILSYRGKDGSAELFQHQIKINGQTFPLNANISATVDSSGNLSRTKRSTLTRMTAGGVMLGPVGILAGGMVQKKKVHDDRELYLMLEGESFAALITCDPAQGAAVRKFAASVNSASKNVRAADSEHESAVALATSNLEVVKARAAEATDVIELKFDTVKADNAELTEAEKALALVRDPMHN